MIVCTLDELLGSNREVRGEGWASRRLLRRDDGMGFSLHWTEVEAGTELELQYEHHLEANLCVEGEGEVVEVATGRAHPLRPGVMYSLDSHERHLVRAHTDLKAVCVFWPPLQGDERHNERGGYDPAGPAAG